MPQPTAIISRNPGQHHRNSKKANTLSFQGFGFGMPNSNSARGLKESLQRPTNNRRTTSLLLFPSLYASPCPVALDPESSPSLARFHPDSHSTRALQRVLLPSVAIFSSRFDVMKCVFQALFGHAKALVLGGQGYELGRVSLFIPPSILLRH